MLLYYLINTADSPAVDLQSTCMNSKSFSPQLDEAIILHISSGFLLSALSKRIKRKKLIYIMDCRTSAKMVF